MMICDQNKKNGQRTWQMKLFQTLKFWWISDHAPVRKLADDLAFSQRCSYISISRRNTDILFRSSKQQCKFEFAGEISSGRNISIVTSADSTIESGALPSAPGEQSGWFQLSRVLSDCRLLRIRPDRNHPIDHMNQRPAGHLCSRLVRFARYFAWYLGNST